VKEGLAHNQVLLPEHCMLIAGTGIVKYIQNVLSVGLLQNASKDQPSK